MKELEFQAKSMGDQLQDAQDQLEATLSNRTCVHFVNFFIHSFDLSFFLKTKNLCLPHYLQIDLLQH